MAGQYFGFRNSRGVLAAFLIALAGMATAEPRHGIAMYGQPALPPDFVSLPQANRDAPKGGRIVLGVNGGFDSLNPFITMGRAAEGVSALTVETLLGRNYDEPFSLYGLLAESVDTDPGRSYVEFTLRDEARFSDGSPVTAEDVLWSFETLGTLGSPRYHQAWADIAKAEISGPGKIRFTFNRENRELPLILGLRPILKKAQWQGKSFEATTFEAPIGSGPYVIDKMDPGVTISYKRNPDWWGKDLPFNRGQWNFDEIRYDYFANPQAQFESFKAGLLSSYRETNALKWEKDFDFPAVTSGDVIKAEIPHHRPSGIEGLAFNTRRPLFEDWRVREALILAFNFEYINQTLTDSLQPRIESYFSNSALRMVPGTAAEGRVAALLEPLRDDLLPGAISGYELPKTDGKPANRRNIRAAAALLEEAGWRVGEDGILRNAAGEPFRFEIILTIGQDDMASISAIYIEALKALGIEARVTMLDSALYQARVKNFDFDMTHHIRSFSLSPGTEQVDYWSTAAANREGSRNWPGVRSAAIDHIIEQMLKSPDLVSYTTAIQALDRALTTGRYVIPIWYSDRARIAHRKELKYPAKLPLYGDWIGFQPDTWWYEE